MRGGSANFGVCEDADGKWMDEWVERGECRLEGYSLRFEKCASSS